ncbi:MAG: hypothetical protein J6571_07035 [Snodgrassella sp.]|uniref:hypothetical protein n=1 Tax=Snodgrassella sp. TaxID=2815304 RepID=UPI002583DADA|nr:hypothetical protein [Snodgrassella sp.]MCO6522919.1 hypothetical protein [Snodgrassella sp.]
MPLGIFSEIRLWKWVQADFVADITGFLSSMYRGEYLNIGLAGSIMMGLLLYVSMRFRMALQGYRQT